MRIRRLRAVAILAAAVVWLTPAASEAQSAPESVPTITVTPDHDLVDGQSIALEGTGLPPFANALAIQCRPGSLTFLDVGSNCELRTAGSVDAAGTVSTFITVEREIQPPNSPDTIDCAVSPGACTVGLVAGFDANAPVVEVPIAFAGPTVPAPTVTVAPATELDDGAVVTVTGAGFPAGAQVDVAQCQIGRPVSSEWCAASPAFTTPADATGAVTGTLTVRRGVTTGSGQVIDCVESGCVVAASTVDGAIWAVDSVTFIHRRVLAFPASSATVSPNGTVDITGSIDCTTPNDAAVNVEGELAQRIGDSVITASFTAATTCSETATWEAQIRGSRTLRFQPGTARITPWANEAVDPFPDDSVRIGTVDIELVRHNS